MITIHDAITDLHRIRRAGGDGLVWRKVDLDTARLTVSQQLLSVEHKLMESGPKTPDSRRTIDHDPTPSHNCGYTDRALGETQPPTNALASDSRRRWSALSAKAFP